MRDLSGLFTPERVAVIGATAREGSVGRALLENLTTFEGEVFPVNPNQDTVLGTTCYPEIGSVPNPASVDLAIVAVPAERVSKILRQVGRVGIRNVVVVTAGFSEAGPEGQRQEAELREIAEEYDLNMVGPNCVGVISTPVGLNATFIPATPREGSISLVSQSGAFISAVLGWAGQHNIGFKDVVSLGNEAVLDEIDFIAEWDDDPETEVIMAYLEDVEDGRRFIETARDVTTDTPIVVIKSGRTEAGAEAAASHTGSIAGSDRAYQAGFEQAGVLRAGTLQEVFDIARALAGQPLPDRNGVAVVTNGGGPGVLATDAIGDLRLDIAEFDSSLRTELDRILPDQADATNPLDIIGDADIDRFERTLDKVLGSDAVGSAVVISVPTAIFEFNELADVIGELQNRHGKPVVGCLMGGDEADRAAETLATYGVPNYFDPARAVTGLEALAEYRDVTDREYDSPREFEVDETRAREVLAQTVAREVDYLGVEAMDLLDAYGIPIPAGGLAESVSEAEAIADDVGGQVVMKIVSPDIVHKSDIGGVKVGVSRDDVAETYQTILDRATDYDPDATILGVQVEEHIELEESTETIVGVNRDPQFGHVLMFGLGGIFVEVFEDTSFRIAPVTEGEARRMTEEIQAAPMLRGARGRTPADIDALVEMIQRISRLVTDFPGIQELDVNPLVVGPDGVRAVDLRLTVDLETE